MAEFFLNGRIELCCDDMLAVLPDLFGNCIDACVCDPPYHLSSIVKRFGAPDAAPAKVGKTGAYARASSGFMGKVWDGGDIAFQVETWAQVLRVLKPGAHLLAFGGTRTYHRMACAIEDAGFEIRDTIMWLYGSGFPKSHDVSKGIDKNNGHWRGRAGEVTIKEQVAKGSEYERTEKGPPITSDAIVWDGWGTALKPACEPIVLARKPLSESTVAANVMKWGTGALNIDGCRVPTDELTPRNNNNTATLLQKGFEGEAKTINPSPLGRWPANIIHDGSAEVLAGFPDLHGPGFATKGEKGPKLSRGIYGDHKNAINGSRHGDSGSTARFFYTAKADTDDRLGSKHPTVKPLDLMQYLVRLVTPPKGTVLDCFAGTGTTGEAAFREGMRAMLIEREAEYQADIRRRMELVLGGPEERARAAIKERIKDKPRDDGPLFGDAS